MVFLSHIASCSLGGAAFCLDTAKNYVKERKQFGKNLSEFQNVQFKLADMATDLVASIIMIRNAAKMIDESVMLNLSCNKTISILKSQHMLPWLKNLLRTNLLM